jgi:nucleolar protein 15
LSAADVRNEFEALQNKIELGLEDANKLAKQMVQPAKKSAAASSTNPDDAPDMQPGVLYIGHLPFGFHERQIEGFLSQFGEVLRVKLARSKRTGGSRHFAFIEFRRLYVAKVVVEAMNGYIMYRRRLACAIVPPEKCHARMWSVSRNIVKSQAERRARSQIAYGASVLDESKAAASEQRRAERAKARADKLAAAGIDLEAIKQKAKQSTAVKTPVAATKKTPKRK